MKHRYTVTTKLGDAANTDIVYADYYTLQNNDLVFKNAKVVNYPEVVKLYASGVWQTVTVEKPVETGTVSHTYVRLDKESV